MLGEKVNGTAPAVVGQDSLPTSALSDAQLMLSFYKTFGETELDKVISDLQFDYETPKYHEVRVMLAFAASFRSLLQQSSELHAEHHK